MIRVGGHHDKIEMFEKWVKKTCKKGELDFYRRLFHAPAPNDNVEFLNGLRDMEYCPRLLEISDTYILLGNILEGMKSPIAADVKIGCLCHDDHAPPEKIERSTRKSMNTTSWKYGFRVVAMNSADESCVVAKKEGDSVHAIKKILSMHENKIHEEDDEEQVLCGIFKFFFKKAKLNIVNNIAEKLHDIVNFLQSTNDRYIIRGASFFIAFDAESDLWDVKLIDFAHVTTNTEKQHLGIDQNFNQGMHTFLNVIKNTTKQLNTQQYNI